MSYSVCIACNRMVPAYEKYCGHCLRKYKVKQDAEFHRRPLLTTYKEEFAKDLREQSLSVGGSK